MIFQSIVNNVLMQKILCLLYKVFLRYFDIPCFYLNCLLNDFEIKFKDIQYLLILISFENTFREILAIECT